MTYPDSTIVVLGVDLAAQPERTAMCELEVRPGTQPVIHRLVKGVTDEAIVEASLHCEMTAIDAPFGWPQPFIGFLRSQETTWPQAPATDDDQALWFRTTDIRMTPLKMPLSVSSDRIARTALRAARVLSSMQQAGLPVDRSGITGRAIEVYPAAGMLCWGPLPTPSYKGRKSENQASRLELARSLVDGLGGVLQPSCAPEVVVDNVAETDDHLDAFVCALIAAAKVLGHIRDPLDEYDPVAPTARAEGWIHLPTHEALALLGAGRAGA